MAEIKFYSDAEKQNQVYPALDPDKEYNITVKAADNLTSPDMSTVRGDVNFRSSGEGADIGTGIAKIEKIKGDAYSTAVPREFEDRLNATGITGYSINEDTFIEEVGQSGTYDFIYTPIVTTSSPNVTITDNIAFADWKNIGNYSFECMPDYNNPILINGRLWTMTFTNKVRFFNNTLNHVPNGYSYPTTGYFILTLVAGGTFSITHSQTGSEVWDTLSQSTSQSTYGLKIQINSPAASNNATFQIIESNNRLWGYQGNNTYSSIPGVTYNGTPSLGESITINYSANEWCLNNNAINLADYGITNLEGTPTLTDIIEVYYKARIIGNVITANNPNFKSIYINQFDKNNNVFGGYIIDADTTYGIGEIVQGQGNVGFFRCLKNQTYTFYFDLDEKPQEEDPLGFVCYYNRKPQITPAPTAGMTLLSISDIASSGQILNNNWKTNYFTAPYDGWLIFSTNDVEHLYCHLTWSGYKDKITNEYEEDIINLQPLYTNNNLPFGLLKVNDNCYDEIDFVDGKTRQRVNRIDYSSSELIRIRGLTDEYIYDNNYIYYNLADDTGIRERNFPSSFTETGDYNVDDFGIECIVNSDGSYIDKDLKFEMDIAYQENLKDKLRRSVEVISNKTSEINANSTDIQYSTAKAVYDMNLLLRSFFGINVNTYDNTKTYEIGDYVVYNLKLYKCMTKITLAENWNLSHWTESQFFKLI